jgi:hypothetical protein
LPGGVISRVMVMLSEAARPVLLVPVTVNGFGPYARPMAGEVQAGCAAKVPDAPVAALV